MNFIEGPSLENASDKRAEAGKIARDLGLSLSFNVEPNSPVAVMEEIYSQTLEALRKLKEEEINRLRGSNIVIGSLDDLKQISSDLSTEKVEEIKKAIGKEGKILRPGDRVFWDNNFYSGSGIITSFKLGNPPDQDKIFATIDTGSPDHAVEIEARELSLIEIRPNISNFAAKKVEESLKVEKTPTNIENLRLRIKERAKKWFDNLGFQLEYALFKYFIEEYSRERTERHLENWNGSLPKGGGTEFVAKLTDPTSVEKIGSEPEFLVEVKTGGSLLELLKGILEKYRGSK